MQVLCLSQTNLDLLHTLALYDPLISFESLSLTIFCQLFEFQWNLVLYFLFIITRNCSLKSPHKRIWSKRARVVVNYLMELVDKGLEKATIHRKEYRRQLHERSGIWAGFCSKEIILICGDDGKEPSKQSQHSPGQGG